MLTKKKTLSAADTHVGHRQRIKHRFLEHGACSFHSEDLLELLLFYSVPKQDTVPIAANLLKKFGSIENIFNANAEDLLSTGYIRYHTATLIKLIPALAQRYYFEAYEKAPRVKTYEAAGEYMTNLFTAEDGECVYCAFVNKTGIVMKYIKLYTGNVNSSALQVKTIIKNAVSVNVTDVIIAHNHGNGQTIPSSEDVNTTCRIKSELALHQIRLVEHFVISENKFLGIIENSILFSKKYNENYNIS